MISATDPHRWFRLRLVAYMAGLLDGAEEREFVGHRSECESCRAAFDEFTTSDEIAGTERGAHIPAAMLARWDRARREIRGLEHAMVREHLKRCEACRGDLELLGHTPDLEAEPAVGEPEPRRRSWWSWFGGTPRSGAAKVADRGERERGPAWLPWALGGWATAATAAVILIVLQPGLIGRVEEPVPAPEPTPAAGAGYVFERVDAVVRLRTARRGIDSDPSIIAARDSTHFVQLVVGALDVPEGDSIDAEVLAGGTRLLHRELGSPSPSGVEVVFGDRSRPLAPGDYRLRLTGRRASGPASAVADTVELAFRIVRARP